MLKGSCACGSISYEISGELERPLTYCHCWRCRKHSGSSFGTTTELESAQLKFVTGEHALKYWESSPGVRRYFAGCCGSPIYKEDDASPGLLGFRLGTLDTDPGRRVEMHYMIESAAPWVEIEDRLTQKEGGDGSFGVHSSQPGRFD